MWFIVKILWTWNLFFTLLEISKPLFFFFPFSAMPLSQLLKKNKIIPLFRQWHCRHCLFFIYFKSTPHSGTLGHTGFGQENWAVEFRQCHCRNSKIFSLLLSLFSLLLFGWISAMPLPKFSLSPQFPNYLWTVHITQTNFEFYNINPKDSKTHTWKILEKKPTHTHKFLSSRGKLIRK